MVKRLAVAATWVGLGLALSGAGATADTYDSAVAITNNSSWNIYNVYVSSVDESEWGQDLMGEEALMSKGGTVDISVDCATYDVKVVDEDGDECVIRSVKLCGNMSWVIDDDELLACQAQTAD